MNYKSTHIILKKRNGKKLKATLEEFCSVTLPYDLINYIYLFMPKHPLVEIVTTGIIDFKNNEIQLAKEQLNYYIKGNNELLRNQKLINDYNTIINGISIIPFVRDIVRKSKRNKIQNFYYYKDFTNKIINNLHLTQIGISNLYYNTWTTQQRIQQQSAQLERRQLDRLENLNERNILPDYTREKRRKKVGLKPSFEKSQKDYYKRKGIKNGKLVEHIKKTGYYNSVRILNDVNN